ncbi:hypothetical protein D3C78_1333760 [compost metagenome]
MVDPAQVLNISVWQPAGQVARPVQSLSVLKRVFDEFLRRQIRPVPISPGEADARDA